MKNRYNIFAALCLLLTLAGTAEAQRTGIVRGYVSDATSGEPLAFCNVYLEELEIGAATDINGYFLIPSVPGDELYKLTASYIGYESQTQEILLLNYETEQVDFQLEPKEIELEAVEKIGRKALSSDDITISVKQYTIREIEALPRGVETDVFRALQYEPGVQSTGDVTAKFHVRGGAANQNLVMLDQAIIYHPFHALGMFSIINPNTISNIEFFKGGFPAEYSDRLSSIVKFNTKDGNKKRFSGQAGGSYLTGKLMVEGPIPNGSFFVAGRKSYSTEILKKFLYTDNVPVDFYDLTFKVNYSGRTVVKDSKFSVFGFLSDDNLDNPNPGREDVNFSNRVFGFNWFQPTEGSIYFNTSFTSSSFEGELIPNRSGTRPIKNRLQDFSWKTDVTNLYQNKNELNIGLKIQKLTNDLILENGRGIIENIGKEGTHISAYGKFMLASIERLRISAGTRINLANPSNDSKINNLLEPRVMLSYKLMPELAFNAAWGIYQQDLITVSDEDEVISLFEPWVIVPDNVGPAQSIHYIAGFDATLWDNVYATLESYYKVNKNVSVLNDLRIYESDPEFVSGVEEAYGLETSVRIGLAPLQIYTGYALSWAYRELDEQRYQPKYDARHALNIGVEANFGGGWSASVVWVYTSGLPFTQVAGYYDKFFFHDFLDQYSAFDPYTPHRILGARNGARLPDYHRLDLRVAKKLHLYDFVLNIEGSIINAYDRKNLFYFDQNTGERVNLLPFLPTVTVELEI